MKKLGLIAGACVLLVGVLLVVAGIWVNGHLEAIARKITGREIHFSGINVSYAPMPTIVLTDLVLKEGKHTVTVPRILLHLDFAKIFSGRISVKKAVLEEPLVVAVGPGAGGSKTPLSGSSGRPPLSMSAIPDGLVVVNHGKLVLQAAYGDGLPVSVTAQAEKVNQGLLIQLKTTSIDEIGLDFVGEVSIASIRPLKLKVKATKGKFNPDAVKDFLMRFGYLTDDMANRIPAIQRVDCKGLNLEFDGASGDITLTAETLDVDRIELRDLAVKLTHGGAFAVSCSHGVLESASVYGWLQQNHDGKTVLDAMLARAKLKALMPAGAVRISSLRLQGVRPVTEGAQAAVLMDGAVDISVQGLTLQLVAENGEEQSLTISRLVSKVTITQGRPSVAVSRLTFSSSQGGTGSITGNIPLPLDLKRTTMKSSIDGFKVFDSTLDFHLNKDGHSKATFDLALDTPSLKVSGDGVVFIPGRKQTDLEARLTNLRIVGAGPDTPNTIVPWPKSETFLERPFDASVVVDKKVSAKVFVKTFQFGDWSRLKDVDLHLEAGNDRAVLNGTIRMCGLNLILGALVVPPSRLVTTLEIKGTDVDLSSLVACFSKALPVYLAGRLFVTGSFVAIGDTPQALIDGAEGDVTLMVSRASVQRISGLDPRLGFILDILRAAHISSEKEDAIAFGRGVINASLQKGRLVFDRFSLVGPMLSAWGDGDFTIKDKNLKLSGGVRTVLGGTRGLVIDRILEKGGT